MGADAGHRRRITFAARTRRNGRFVVFEGAATRPNYPSRYWAPVKEISMWKAVVVGVGAVALAGTTILMAQDRGQGPRRGPEFAQGEQGGHRWGGRGMMGGEHRKLSADDMRAFAEARIAGLHAGLALRPDQEKYWPALETALRARAKDRIDRIQARMSGQQQPVTDPVERLKRAADAATRRGAALKAIADAAAPLYGSLDDAQKERFKMLARFGHHRHMGWRHRLEQRGEEGKR
jgi:zinc resistance-associated protein